jgi:uncharacterized protein (TIGR02145 family)
MEDKLKTKLLVFLIAGFMALPIHGMPQPNVVERLLVDFHNNHLSGADYTTNIQYPKPVNSAKAKAITKLVFAVGSDFAFVYSAGTSEVVQYFSVAGKAANVAMNIANSEDGWDALDKTSIDLGVELMVELGEVILLREIGSASKRIPGVRTGVALVGVIVQTSRATELNREQLLDEIASQKELLNFAGLVSQDVLKIRNEIERVNNPELQKEYRLLLEAIVKRKAEIAAYKDRITASWGDHKTGISLDAAINEALGHGTSARTIHKAFVDNVNDFVAGKYNEEFFFSALRNEIRQRSAFAVEKEVLSKIKWLTDEAVSKHRQINRYGDRWVVASQKVSSYRALDEMVPWTRRMEQPDLSALTKEISQDIGNRDRVPIKETVTDRGEINKITIPTTEQQEQQRQAGEQRLREVDAKQNDPFQGQMVFVRSGTFTMGCTSEQGSDCFESERPARQVTVSDFYIGKYEVTQAQWQQVMGSNPSYYKGNNLPVESVSWNDVQEFIRKLNQQTGKRYRLPTEAEWEFAARGGNNSQGYKYSGSNSLSDVAWYEGKSGRTSQPVGQKKSNELGLYDMSGNVYEWCNDWRGNYSSTSEVNPKGPSSGSLRIKRGGFWDDNPEYCRVASRGGSRQYDVNSFTGFRLAHSSDLIKEGTSEKSDRGQQKSIIESDYFIDQRDGKKYKTVKIGDQVWMAENLAYLPAVHSPTSGSNTEPRYYVYGYNGSEVATAKQQPNYTTYGVLYNWSAARTACPSGWHLPTDAEWTALENYLIANGYNYDGTKTGNKIAKSLAATTNWSADSDIGTIGNNLSLNNKSGFSALPGGGRDRGGLFEEVGEHGSWWSYTEYDSSNAWGRGFGYDDVLVKRGPGSKSFGASVRCIRD